MEKHYYSCGKLLITGEYAVLHGATALALPTKLGQSLTVKSNKSPNLLTWKAMDEESIVWFHCELEIDSLLIRKTDNKEIADRLVKMLSYCKLNSDFLDTGSFDVITHCEFPVNYGLGTSSTLINNLAYWANIDPFLLLKETFSGSGFDVAVAQCNNGVMYYLKNTSPNWKKRDVFFPFHNNLFFVHLNKKAISRDSIKDKIDFTIAQIEKITEISTTISQTTILEEFENLLNTHEKIIAEATGKTPIKNELFMDFQGTIKSLGAWGGDFILVTGNRTYVDKYFKYKGYNSIFAYSELILKH